ncbi:MAG TPA: CopG family antitoxin [bacterium]|nr:CopG family antitoxin [bacterium]
MSKKNGLTPEEKAEKEELLSLLDSGVPKISDSRKLELQKAAQKTIARTKPVSIRLPVKELAEIQERAEEIGVPYQTLINILIKQYLQGKIQLIL